MPKLNVYKTTGPFFTVLSFLLVFHFCQSAILITLLKGDSCSVVCCSGQKNKPAKDKEKQSCPMAMRCDPANCFFTVPHNPAVLRYTQQKGTPVLDSPSALSPFKPGVWQPPEMILA